MADRPGVWQCTYYPSTESLVPPYQHHDYTADFDTKPVWDNAIEDAEGYIEWHGGGGCAGTWYADPDIASEGTPSA